MGHYISKNEFVCVQVMVLKDLGGRTLEEIVRRLMKFVLNNELAMQLNVCGRFGKVAFGPTRLFGIIYSKLINYHKYVLIYSRMFCFASYFDTDSDISSKVEDCDTLIGSPFVAHLCGHCLARKVNYSIDSSLFDNHYNNIGCSGPFAGGGFNPHW